MAPALDADVLIAGAGPAGCATAMHLLARDPAWAGRLRVLDRARFPRHKLCGGAVTDFGTQQLRRLDLGFDAPSFGARELRLVYRGRRISLFGEPVVRITRREVFDSWLLAVAGERGVRVRQGETVREVAVASDCVRVRTDAREYRAAVLVAADGANSAVRRSLGWPGASSVARALEVALHVDEAREPAFTEAVALFDFTPTGDGLQGYYWDFPSRIEGRAVANRGVFDSRICSGAPLADLKRIFGAELRRQGADPEAVAIEAFPIRWWDRESPLAQERVLTVGDAAGTDPLFGEGIPFALAYGELGADLVAEAFERSEFGFADYASRRRAHGLLQQLETRTRIARTLYARPRPFATGLVWSAVGLLVRRPDLAGRFWNRFSRLVRRLPGF